MERRLRTCIVLHQDPGRRPAGREVESQHVYWSGMEGNGAPVEVTSGYLDCLAEVAMMDVQIEVR